MCSHFISVTLSCALLFYLFSNKFHIEDQEDFSSCSSQKRERKCLVLQSWRKITTQFLSNYNQNYKTGVLLYNFCLFLKTKVCKKCSICPTSESFWEGYLLHSHDRLLLLWSTAFWSSFGVLPLILRQTDPVSILSAWTSRV